MRLTILLLVIFQVAGHAQPFMQRASKKLIYGSTADERKEAALEIRDALFSWMLAPEHFEAPLDSLPVVASVIPEDGAFRILTWQANTDSGKAVYHGLVVFKGSKQNHLVALNQTSYNKTELPFRLVKPDAWYGALYYQVIIEKHKGDKIYTLLGYNQFSDSLQFKVVDVMQFGKYGKNLRFGQTLFETPTWQDVRLPKRPYRLLYQYSRKFTATLKHKTEEDKIIMDHLSPPDAAFKKRFALYGPDFTYDALFWKDGKWNLEEGVTFQTGIVAPIRPPDSAPE